MNQTITGANGIHANMPQGDGRGSPQLVNNPIVNAVQGLAQSQGVAQGAASHFSSLPVELRVKINSYLDPASKKVMSQTCQSELKLFFESIPSLKRSATVLEQTFRLFPNAYPNMHTLQITDTPTIEQIQHFAAKTRESVQHLDLSKCEELPDDVFVSLLNCLTNLTSLDLSGSSGVTGDADIAQVEPFPGVAYLNLRDCRELTGDALIPIGVRFPNSVFVNLSNCSGVNDQALAEASTILARMAYLDLSGCLQLTDMGVSALSANRPNLISLNLSGCNLLTDASILALADNCRNLAFLTLSGCTRVTDQVLIALARNCTYLNSLQLNGRLFNRSDLQGMLDAVIE